MADREKVNPHPNDGCDEDKCYEVMMAERTVLITASRESQDNLIKTIITLASSLIALMAGFASQPSIHLSGFALGAFSTSVGAFGGSIIAGLCEQFFSSRAYDEQLTMLQDFYGKYIDKFSDASSNKYVRACQFIAFLLFIVAFCCLGSFAIFEAGATRNVQQTAAASAAAPTSAAAAPAASPATSHKSWPRPSTRSTDQVSSSTNASATSKEGGMKP